MTEEIVIRNKISGFERICIFTIFTLSCLISFSTMRQPIATVPDENRIGLIVLDPDHFHAALLQKTMYAGVWDTVKVYAPEGPGLRDYLQLIEKYNTRPEDRTHWTEQVYTGADYLQKMSMEKKGSVVIISGNNKSW